MTATAPQAPLSALLFHDGEALAERLAASVELLRAGVGLDLELPGDAPPGLDASRAEFGALRDGLVRPYRLMVAGVQNSGKSTLTNLLLGQWLMTSAPRNVDAVLSHVTWAPEPTARIHYLAGTSHQIPIEEAVALLDQGNDHLAAEQARIDHVWIGLPNPNLRTFVLVNTPGLNDKPEISARTQRFFKEADAILWVFNAVRLEERSITGAALALCRGNGHKLVAVLNRADEVTKMGGQEALDAVHKRFERIFDGCYSAVFRLDAKSAALGIGVHPKSDRRTAEQREVLLASSGYAELIEYCHATWFGHEQREAKLRGCEERAGAVRRSVEERCDGIGSALEQGLDADDASGGDLRRVRRRILRNRNRVNVALRAVVERHGDLLVDAYLASVDAVSRDVIDLIAMLKGSKRVAAEFQAALDAAVELRLPAETFTMRLTRDLEATLIDGWMEFADELDRELDLNLEIAAVVPGVGEDVRVDGPIGRVIEMVIRTVLGLALKKGGERLVRQGLTRAIQLAIRAVVKTVIEMVGKRFTMALMRSLAKYISPALWILAVLDAKKLTDEVRNALGKARADVRLELEGQRTSLFETLYDAAVETNDRVLAPLLAAIHEQLDEAEQARALVEARLEAIAALKSDFAHLWAPIQETP